MLLDWEIYESFWEKAYTIDIKNKDIGFKLPDPAKRNSFFECLWCTADRITK